MHVQYQQQIHVGKFKKLQLFKLIANLTVFVLDLTLIFQISFIILRILLIFNKLNNMSRSGVLLITSKGRILSRSSQNQGERIYFFARTFGLVISSPVLIFSLEERKIKTISMAKIISTNMQKPSNLDSLKNGGLNAKQNTLRP